MRITTLYIIAFFLAAASIVYELLIAHTLSLLGANTVFWYSATIGVYLGAMGVGSLFAERAWGRVNVWRALFYAELGLVLSGALAIILINEAHALHSFFLLREWFVLTASIVPAVSFAIIAGIGVLTGFELPLLIRAAREKTKRRHTNRILAADYAGSLAGAVALPLFLLPNFEDMLIGFFVALVNLLIAIVILSRALPSQTIRFREVGLAGALLSSIFIGIFHADTLEQYFLKKYYFYHASAESVPAFLSSLTDLPEIERTRSPYQKIDIFRSPDKEYPEPLIGAYSGKFKENPDYPRGYYLFLNGDYQVLSDVDELYHEWFAHVAIAISETPPEDVLILGGGDGLIDKELLKYEEVRSITHVDIDPVVLGAAKTHPVLSRMNEGALLDKRVRIHAEDAFYFMKNNTKKFDAIYIDFPFAKDYTISRLYSREFYHFVRRALREGGFAVIDAPDSEFYTRRTDEGELYTGPGDGWEIYYHTLKAAGFEGILPYTSLLEMDNEEALRVIEHLLLLARFRDPENAGEYNDAETILFNYVQSTAQGFIVVRDKPFAEKLVYNDPDIPLYALNEARFNLSVNLPYPMLEETDREKVNSIMRPALLNPPTWGVKRPY